MNDYVVFLDDSKLEVTLDNKNLRMRKPDEKTKFFPINYIGQVVIFGSPKVACNVWQALAENAIPSIIFPGRGRGMPVWIAPGLSASVMVRVSQHEASKKSDSVDKVCRWLLDLKLFGHQTLIAGFLQTEMDDACEDSYVTNAIQSLNPSDRDYFEKAMNDINTIKQNLKSATGREQLMGYEGAAAHIWFDVLSRLLPKEWKFTGRNRRPPKDPINALMSLTYTMTMGDVHTTIHERGLDPCIGFLHALHPGRESLVLDVLEPLRCGADAFVLHLLDCGIRPKHFTYSDENGCRLNKEGRKIYFSQWAEYRLEWPYFLIDKNNLSQIASSDDYAFYDDDDDENDAHYTKSLKKCCWWIIKDLIAHWEDKPEKF